MGCLLYELLVRCGVLVGGPVCLKRAKTLQGSFILLRVPLRVPAMTMLSVLGASRAAYFPRSFASLKQSHCAREQNMLLSGSYVAFCRSTPLLCFDLYDLMTRYCYPLGVSGFLVNQVDLHRSVSDGSCEEDTSAYADSNSSCCREINSGIADSQARAQNLLQLCHVRPELLGSIPQGELSKIQKTASSTRKRPPAIICLNST